MLDFERPGAAAGDSIARVATYADRNPLQAVPRLCAHGDARRRRSAPLASMELQLWVPELRQQGGLSSRTRARTSEAGYAEGLVWTSSTAASAGCARSSARGAMGAPAPTGPRACSFVQPRHTSTLMPVSDRLSLHDADGHPARRQFAPHEPGAPRHPVRPASSAISSWRRSGAAHAPTCSSQTRSATHSTSCDRDLVVGRWRRRGTSHACSQRPCEPHETGVAAGLRCTHQARAACAMAGRLPMTFNALARRRAHREARKQWVADISHELHTDCNFRAGSRRSRTGCARMRMRSRRCRPRLRARRAGDLTVRALRCRRTHLHEAEHRSRVAARRDDRGLSRTLRGGRPVPRAHPG